MLAAFMNTNTGGGHHSANYVEKQVIDWFKEIFGFPISAGGLLTSGCSAANLIGLAVARNVKAGYDLRREGLQNARNRLTLYASLEAHSSIQKAVELLGLGSDALRLAPVNEALQVDVKALERAIAQDREQGCQPICVVGAAGTTNTGAIDDLDALADLCQEQDLWFHIDGAFGAWGILASSEVQGQLDGMERADSLAFDLHKWMYVPYEVGCVLVRREPDQRNAFSLTPAYLAHGGGGQGLSGGDLTWFSDYGFQLSRGFRALKVWMSLKEHGLNQYGRLIQQNIDQAHYLAELVEAAPELELVAPVNLNIVCFRYVQDGLDDTALNKLNEQVIVELQERGIAAPTGTTLNGRYVIHVANTNHRSRRQDFERLVREVIRVARKVVSGREVR
jgi:glutamate/tyrosine decarboxylase-like PLP-dependent enzyme